MPRRVPEEATFGIFFFFALLSSDNMHTRVCSSKQSHVHVATMVALNAVLRLVPPSADVLVDVSNIRQEQLDEILRSHRHPCFVSTHKSFNYIQNSQRLSIGTKGGAGRRRPVTWIVLSLPLASHGKKDSSATTTRAPSAVSVSKWDPHSERFERVPSRSPVRLDYKTSPKKKSVCSIRNRSGRVGTPLSHRYCELDDLVLHALSLKRGLTLATNDRALRENVENGTRPHWSRAPTALLRHARVTRLVLTKDGGGWVKT